MLNARKISISALIRVLHKMIITVMYRMHFKQQGVYKYGNIFKSGK